jgi:Glycosyl hydrolases family 43
LLLLVSQAATRSIKLEPESSSLSSQCIDRAAGSASNSNYIIFDLCDIPTFDNPVAPNFTGWGAPNVVKGPDNHFYSIGSQPGAKVKKSASIHTGWQELTVPTFTNSQKVGGIDFPPWAAAEPTLQPRWMGTELHFINNTWVLAASFLKLDPSRPSSNPRVHVVAIATSSAENGPTGPYTWGSDQSDVYHSDENHVDPTFFSEGSKLWLLYNVSYLSNSDNKAIRVVELNPQTLLPISSTDKIILSTTVDNKAWEDDCTGDRIEAPGLFKHNNTYFLYYAAGSDDLAHDDGTNVTDSSRGQCPYKLGIARSQSITSSGMFEKHPTPILEGQTTPNCGVVCWRGPGHGSHFISSTGQYYFFYQAKQTTNGSKTSLFQEMKYSPESNWFYFDNNQIKHQRNIIPNY